MLRGAVALTLCAWTAVAAAEPTTAQKQALIAKPSVVRVVAVWEIVYGFNGRQTTQYAGGTGSGFFVSADGYIATNAHVVQDIHEGEAAARREVFGRMMQELQKEGLSRADLDIIAQQIKFVKATPTAEVVLPDGTHLPYEIKAYGAPVGEGKDVAIIKVATQNAPNLPLGDADKVAVQDKVLAIGYPGAADMQGLLDNKSQLEASVTDGAVSAKKHSTDGELVLQVSVPITHGNSGGPCINEAGEVIGLTTFGNKDEVQGFNFLVASSTVAKFVGELKIDTKLSNTSTLWRKALDEYWAEDYDAAIPDLEEVMTLFPTHSEAIGIAKVARAAKKDGKGKKPESGGVSGGAIAGIVIGSVLVLGLIVILAMRKKKPAQAASGPRMMQPQMMAPPHPSAPPGMYPGMQPQPMMPAQGGVMVAGRAGPAPVARTVAIGGSGSGPMAATAFASMSLGSLTCIRGQLHGQRFALGPTGVLIGRQPGVAQIVINDARASGKHVWIGFENGVLVAVDQGTTNGTFVNDVRYGRISKATLKDGDTVIVSEPDCLSLQLKLS